MERLLEWNNTNSYYLLNNILRFSVILSISRDEAVHLMKGWKQYRYRLLTGTIEYEVFTVIIVSHQTEEEYAGAVSKNRCLFFFNHFLQSHISDWIQAEETQMKVKNVVKTKASSSHAETFEADSGKCSKGRKVSLKCDVLKETCG